MFSFFKNQITYRVVFPKFPVNTVIDHFLIMKGEGLQITERLSPNNKFELLFNLGDPVKGKSYTPQGLTPTFEKSIVSGLRHVYFDFHSPPKFFVTGMRFTLFGFHQLFKIPAHYFTDTNIVATDLWKQEIEQVHEQLCEATKDEAIFSILTACILKRLTTCSLTDILVWNKMEKLLSSQQMPLSAFIDRHLGYSQKHAIELFKSRAGIGPNKIRKIMRFEEAARKIATLPVKNWAALAYECGFADQSHLIREFKAFSGLTPPQYQLSQPIFYLYYQKLSCE